jgi:outer membrane cobalamin receptor
MTIRKNGPFMLVLAQAIGAGAWIAASPPVMAQQKAQDQAQEHSQKQEQPVRKMVTGSNIARVRTENTLPLLVLDRAYIDQSAATSTTELIQALPQAQNFRSPAPARRR